MYKPVVIKSTRHYGSNFWNCFSHKINRDVHFYNELEYEHWIHIETNPRIIDFCEKTEKIKGVINNCVYESIIDMWIKWDTGKEEFIKVSYEDKKKVSEINQKKLQIQVSWCNDNNYIHRIETVKSIRIYPYLKNLKTILPYIKDFNNINDILIFKIMNLFKQERESHTLKNLLNYLEPIDTYSFYKTIFYLYYHGHIEIDIYDNAFNQNSRVWLKNGKL
jgi:hypothetical protein